MATNVTQMKPKRRFFRPRFTLAALLVLITIIAIPLAYVAQRRAWNLKRIAAYRSLNEKDYSLRIGPAPGIAAVPVKPSTLQRFWNTVVLDEQFPPFTLVALQDKDGADGPRPSPTDEDLLALALFHEIEGVELAHCDAVTDRGLTAIANLPKLRSLVLQSMPHVTGSFLDELGDSKELTWLWLEYLPNLEGTNLAAIRDLPNLHTFKLFMCPKLTDESLQDVSLPGQIEHLSLAELEIGDATISRWLGETQPKSLTLNVDVSRAIAPSLSKQVSLNALAIWNAPLQDEDFAFLARCTELHQLSLRGIPVRGAFLSQIPNPDQMRFLTLSSTLIADENASALRRFQCADTVTLDFTPIHGECFGGSSEWPAWRYLNLVGTEFGEIGKNAVAGIQGPKSVDLPFNWSQDDFKRCPEGKPAYTPGGRTGIHYMAPTERIDRIDRTSPDLMAPVIRLHKLVREVK